jgi:hypothetical protein
VKPGGETHHDGSEDDKEEELIPAAKHIGVILLEMDQQEEEAIHDGDPGANPRHDIELGEKEKRHVIKVQQKIGNVCGVTSFANRFVATRFLMCL